MPAIGANNLAQPKGPAAPAGKAAPAASLLGAGKAAQLAPPHPILPGPGVTPKQAAIENYNVAKLRQTPQTARTFTPPKTTASKSSSPGVALAAIRGGSFPGVDNIVGKLFSEAVHLPVSMVEGSAQLGGAALDDLTHGRFGSTNLGTALGKGRQSELQSTVAKAAAQDPAVSLVTGHPGRALQQAEQAPLNALLDATGVYGVAGRAAGAVARSGALGDTLANATKLARDSREVAPGIPGTAVRQSYSPNAITQLAQKIRESHAPSLQPGILDRAGVTGVTHDLKRQVADFYGPEKARYAQEYQNMAKAAKESKPAGKDEANAAPYATAFGNTDAMHNLLQRYREVRAGAAGPLSPSTSKLLDQHIANLEQALANPHLDRASIEASAGAYRERQAHLEQEKMSLGLHEDPELARALEKQYAVVQMPGVHFMDKPVADPAWINEKRAAAGAIRDAQQRLDEAKNQAAANTGAHQGASRAVADAARRLPLHPVTDALGSHLMDLRSAIEQSRGEYRDSFQNLTAALKDHVDHAHAEYRNIRDNPRKIQGLVVEDPTAAPLRSGPLKGMTVRPLGSDEIQAHMAAHGADPAYIRMTNPERMRPMTTADLGRRGAEGRTSATGKAATGQAQLVGDWVPGYKSMVRSQLGDVSRIADARMTQGFIDRFGLKKPDGTYFKPHEAQHAAAEYETQHGIPMSAVNVGADRTTLIPTAAVKEFQAQRALETPGQLGKLSMKANRAFRNTVLPMSPKLPIMHTVENATRAALAGATPTSYALARSTMNRMKELEMSGEIPAGATARLKDLAVPGGMGGHQLSLDQEDLGRLNPRTTNPILRAAGAPIRFWDQMSHHIIGAQRAIESHAQMAALGVHMRQALQEWGHTWADANTTVSKYQDALAHGYANPQMAEDAAKLVRKTMGQYNSFTARQRMLISRVAPFAPWYMNAAKLVYHELPFGHPLKTALLTETAQANQNQWDAQRAGLPADMQSFAKLGPGHWLDVGKFTPIGIEKSPLEEGVPLLFPQYVPAAMALAGKDPFFRDFKGPDTAYGQSAIQPLSWAAGLHAVDQLAESMAGPVSALARSLQSNGQTMYNTSMPMFGSVQLKPGTQHGPGGVLGGFEKTFNPFGGVYFDNQGSAAPASGQVPRNALKGAGLTLKGSGNTLKGHTLTLKGGR